MWTSDISTAAHHHANINPVVIPAALSAAVKSKTSSNSQAALRLIFVLSPASGCERGAENE